MGCRKPTPLFASTNLNLHVSIEHQFEEPTEQTDLHQGTKICNQHLNLSPSYWLKYMLLFFGI
jgi:hypothetical protein